MAAFWSFKFSKGWFDPAPADQPDLAPKAAPPARGVNTSSNSGGVEMTEMTSHQHVQQGGASETDSIAKHESSLKTTLKGRILGEGVCRLGKFGALAIMITIGILVITIFVVGNTQHDDKESMRDLYLSLAIIQCVMAGVPFVISAVLNPPLLIRSLPFYIMQVGIILLFFALYFTI